MKRYLIIILFLSIKICWSQNSIQSGRIVYSIQWDQNKIDSYLNSERDKVKDRNIVEYVDQVFLNAPKIIAELQFSNFESIYNVIPQMETDDKNNLAFNVINGNAGSNNIYYQNAKDKAILMQECNLLSKCYLVNISFNNWKVEKESRLISNYKCYKAILYKDDKPFATAWFSPEINLPFGPREFAGLPGLVLRLETGNLVFQATNVNLNLNNVTIKKPKKGIEIAEKQYEKLLRQTYPNPNDN